MIGMNLQKKMQMLPSPGPATERKPGPIRGAKTHGATDGIRCLLSPSPFSSFLSSRTRSDSRGLARPAIPQGFKKKNRPPFEVGPWTSATLGHDLSYTLLFFSRSTNHSRDSR